MKRPGKDLENAELGDQRRAKRGAQIAESLANRPERSLPEAFENKSDLELAYRWLGNEQVKSQDIIASHAASSFDRAMQYPLVLAVHDTTDIIYPCRDGRLRKNLSRITRRTQGYFAHTTALVAQGENKNFLGIVGMQPYVHSKDVKDDAEALQFWKEQGGIFENESARWAEAVLSCRDNTPAGLDVIHTGDRETDSYEFHATMAMNQIRYVMRSHWDRVVSGENATENSRISEQLAAAPWIETTRTVPLSARSGDRSAKDLKTNPPRNKRWATLSCRACSIEVKRPSHLAKNEHLPTSINMNVVEVLERESGDAAPVRWVLLTTESVSSDEDIFAIIDIYRARWQIEEFFKCLKSGCLIEKAQLDTASALLNLLAVMMPVATYLLHIRHMHREHPEEPATTLFADEEIQALQNQYPKHFSSPTPTVAEVVLAVAALGGHQKRNGDPGWLTLARGTNALYLLMLGWRAAMKFNNGD